MSQTTNPTFIQQRKFEKEKNSKRTENSESLAQAKRSWMHIRRKVNKEIFVIFIHAFILGPGKMGKHEEIFVRNYCICAEAMSLLKFKTLYQQKIKYGTEWRKNKFSEMCVLSICANETWASSTWIKSQRFLPLLCWIFRERSQLECINAWSLFESTWRVNEWESNWFLTCHVDVYRRWANAVSMSEVTP